VTEVNRVRRYASPLRAATAADTRRRILDAAEELFVAEGYAGTTVDEIAERAGVSKPTVFASVGSKRTLLKLLRDRALAGDEEPVPVRQRPWYQRLLAEPDPARSLRRYAHEVTEMLNRVAPLEDALRSAAAVDPELRELWQTSEGERRVGAQTVVDALLDKGRLRPSLNRDAAVDLLWALTAGEPFVRLVHHRRWSVESYARWLGDTFCDQLLGGVQSAAECNA
jgi:AcrR family transcriptional regulator